MKKVYLLQVLPHDKEEICNYAYYDTKYHAEIVANALKKCKLLKIEYYRIKEINVY